MQLVDFGLGNISSESWTLVTKCAFVIWLFLLTVMFALLPLIVIKGYRTERDPDKRVRYSRLIGLLNCFAGGVFLGTALLHLLPKVMDMLNQLRADTKFPVAEFTVALGFLVVLVMEQISLACKEQEVDTMSPIERICQPVHSEIHSLRADEIQTCHELPALVEEEPTSHLRSVLLLATLSIHSVFEGLAIGLQSDLDSVLDIFIAVMVHKVVISFSVGLSLLQSQLRLVAVVALDVLFALMSPLGLVLGLYVDTLHNSTRQLLFSGMLQGIACGTFLYITCFELLPRELSGTVTPSRDRLLKLLLLLFGFSSTVGVIFMDGS